MKLFPILALSAIAITANAQDYKIIGKTGESLENKMVYLIDYKDMKSCDSCLVKEGAFKFEGNADEQRLFMIRPKRGRERTTVVADKGYEVTVDFTSNPAVIGDNGKLNTKLAKLMNMITEESQAIRTKGSQLQNEGKSWEEISEALKPDFEMLHALYRNSMEENKDNMIGAYILSMVASTLYPTSAELGQAIERVKYADRLTSIKRICTELEKTEATSAGKMFIDFEGFNIDGGASKLSDYVGKGKYVLVDFWASWCGPCKGEIPNIIELYNKFGGDKFTVLGINVWDEEENFKKALTEEGITYQQIFVPKNNKDNATDMYGIGSIPQIMMFGPDGTILKRDLRGEEMKKFVEEQLK